MTTSVVHHIAIQLCAWQGLPRLVDIFTAPNTVAQSLGAFVSAPGLGDRNLTPIELDGYDMGATTKGTFRPAPLEALELGDGVIHLYKDESPPSPPDETGVAPAVPGGREAAERVLAILAVPSYMTSSDLIGFLGSHVLQMSHIRLVRTPRLNRYMVLMKFRSAKDATAFRKAYDGKAFNSIDAETAHVVAIGSVAFAGRAVAADEFPDLATTSSGEQGSGESVTASGTNGGTTSTTKHAGVKPLPPATGSLTELPTCVICLERMDDTVTGLLTILCDHTFHCSCIDKWVATQSTCPVCRFSVARAAFEDTESKSCATCLADKNLWMCLICGNVACGRYESQHAIAHYETCSHAFAMDLDSGRIWDYASDSYVHRLVQDKLDAKPSASKQSFWSHKPDASTSTSSHAFSGSGGGGDSDYDSFSNGGTEFEELLATQLESQRIYYEDQVKAAVDKCAKHARDSAHSLAELAALRNRLAEVESSAEDVAREGVSVRDALKRSDAKSASMALLARKLEAQYKEEKAINASLMQRIAHLESTSGEVTRRSEVLEAEKCELEEQLRDLFMHLEGKAKIETLDDESKMELQQGSLGVKQGKKSSARRKK